MFCLGTTPAVGGDRSVTRRNRDGSRQVRSSQSGAVHTGGTARVEVVEVLQSDDLDLGPQDVVP